MRNRLLMTMGMFALTSVQAQEMLESGNNESKAINNGPVLQVGLNSGLFVQQFMFNSITTIGNLPYLAQFKLISEKGNGLRLGINADYSTSENPNGNGNTERVDLYTDVRLGVEHQVSISKRWTSYVAFDAIFTGDQENIISDSPFGSFEQQTKNYGIGGGPVIGIQFSIHERIHLFTESTAYFTYNEKTSRMRFSGTPVPIPDELTSDSGLNFNMTFPLSIFLAIDF